MWPHSLWRFLAQVGVLAAAAVELLFLLWVWGFWGPDLWGPDLESGEAAVTPNAIVAYAVCGAHVGFLVVAGLGLDPGRMLPYVLLDFGIVLALWVWFIFYVAERDSSVAWAFKVALMTAPLIVVPTMVASVLLVSSRARRAQVSP